MASWTKAQIIIKSHHQSIISSTSSSLNLPALHILSNSSPPAAYSITIARWVGVSNTCDDECPFHILIKKYINHTNQHEKQHAIKQSRTIWEEDCKKSNWKLFQLSSFSKIMYIPFKDPPTHKKKKNDPEYWDASGDL